MLPRAPELRVEVVRPKNHKPGTTATNCDSAVPSRSLSSQPEGPGLPPPPPPATDYHLHSHPTQAESD